MSKHELIIKESSNGKMELHPLTAAYNHSLDKDVEEWSNSHGRILL